MGIRDGNRAADSLGLSRSAHSAGGGPTAPEAVLTSTDDPKIGEEEEVEGVSGPGQGRGDGAMTISSTCAESTINQVVSRPTVKNSSRAEAPRRAAAVAGTHPDAQ
jgi:hypothetical protein